MGGQLLYGFFEDKAVDEADQPCLLSACDEIAPGDDLSLLVAHPQQAFEIIDSSGRRANDGLKGKKQAILTQRRFHGRGRR
jgi:hypothetical protein